MFEFLLLTSIALIVFSQELPTKQQKNQKSVSTDAPSGVNSKKTKNLIQAPPKQKKQPQRNIFERAA